MTLRAVRLPLAFACLAIAGAIVGGSVLARSDEVVVVPAGASLRQALSAAPSGATVRLGPGIHEGPLVIGRELALHGSEGTIIRAPADADAAATIVADDVLLRDVRVIGGSTGVLIEHAHDVELESIHVSGAELHGILIAGSQAHVTDATVSGLRSPYAQGIELFDSPETVVQGSKFSGGQEGIASFLSRDVRLQGNLVTDTSMRAIAVNEMSEARVAHNVIKGSAGTGIYCGDMSLCEFSGNHVDKVTPGVGGKSAAGWGLVVEYHAIASIDDDTLTGRAGATTTLTSGRIVRGSPLERGASWGVLVPGALAVLAAAGIVVLGLGAGRLVLRIAPLGPSTATSPAVAVLLAGTAIQTFHIAEHFLQVFRVHADAVPSRGGIVGSVVEPEWVHFVYNAAVLAVLVFCMAARGKSLRVPGVAVTGDRLLAAALVVQSYHVVEHTVKLIQHISSGAKVNPGILGSHVDLVWLHFAINLAVYAAMAGACVAYLAARRARLLAAAPA